MKDRHVPQRHYEYSFTRKDLILIFLGSSLTFFSGGVVGYFSRPYLEPSAVTSTQSSRLETLAEKGYQEYPDDTLKESYDKFFDVYGRQFGNIFQELIQTSGASNAGALQPEKYHEIVKSTINDLAKEDAAIIPLLEEMKRRRKEGKLSKLQHNPSPGRIIEADVLYPKNKGMLLPAFSDPEILFAAEDYKKVWVPDRLKHAKLYATRTGRYSVSYGIGWWVPSDYFKAESAKK